MRSIMRGPATGAAGSRFAAAVALADGENERCGDQAERSGDEERRQIARQRRAGEARAERRKRCAHLMAGEDPAEHQVGALAAEARDGEASRCGGTVAIQSRP